MQPGVDSGVRPTECRAEQRTGLSAYMKCISLGCFFFPPTKPCIQECTKKMTDCAQRVEVDKQLHLYMM